MKFKKKILFLLLLNIGVFNTNAAEEPDVNKKTIAETQVQDINNTLDSEYLTQYYKESSGGSRVNIDYQYLINKPMTMDEIIDLKHPYFDKTLSNLSDDDIDKIINNKMQNKFKGLRNNAIYDEAVKYGIQSSMYKILTDFNIKLEKIAPYYAKSFNFNTLMLYNGRVKPPVVIESNNSLEKENKVLLRTIKKSFTFDSQAEVVINTPSFRDYLTHEPIPPEQPNILLLPLPNKPEEMSIWKKGAAAGWMQGVRQSYIVINEGLISLVRDYNGMIRYTIMLDEGLVSLPIITKSDLSTKSNGNTMNIGESTFAISVLPEFETNSQKWLALPRVEDIFEENFYVTEKDLKDIEEIKEELETYRN